MPYDQAVTSKANQSRAPMPSAVRRLGWWFALPLVVAGAVPIANRIPAVHSAMGAPTPWIWVGLPALLLAPNAVTIIAVWRGLRRVRSAVGAASGHACTSCLYDLTGLGDTGLCPECGRPFDIVIDRRSWAGVKMLL